MKPGVASFMILAGIAFATACIADHHDYATLPALSKKAGTHAAADLSRYSVEVLTTGDVLILPKSREGAGEPFIAGRLEYQKYDRGRRRIVHPKLVELTSASAATQKLAKLDLSGKYEDGTAFSISYLFAPDSIQITAGTAGVTPPGLAIANLFHYSGRSNKAWAMTGGMQTSSSPVATVRLDRDAEIVASPVDSKHNLQKLSYRVATRVPAIPFEEVSIRGPWTRAKVVFTPDRDSELRIIQADPSKPFTDGYAVKLPLSKITVDGKPRKKAQVLRIRVR